MVPGGAAPIRQPARDAFLRVPRGEGREYLAANGVAECEALVPHITRFGAVGYRTDGMWCKVKQEAQRWRGTPFCLQMMTTKASVSPTGAYVI